MCHTQNVCQWNLKDLHWFKTCHLAYIEHFSWQGPGGLRSSESKVCVLLMLRTDRQQPPLMSYIEIERHSKVSDWRRRKKQSLIKIWLLEERVMYSTQSVPTIRTTPHTWYKCWFRVSNAAITNLLHHQVRSREGSMFAPPHFISPPHCIASYQRFLLHYLTTLLCAIHSYNVRTTFMILKLDPV